MSPMQATNLGAVRTIGDGVATLRWRALRPPVFFAWAAILLLTVALAFVGDAPIDAWVRANPDSQWKPLAWFVTRYGEWYFLLAAALVAWGAAVWWKQGRLETLALAMALTCGATGATATLIRSVSGRTRPNAATAQGWYGLHHNGCWNIGRSEFNSFPSGHVGAAVGFVMPLILGTRRGRWLGVGFGLAMGWARVFTGYHHLSDVVVATIIGVAGGWLIWRRMESRLPASLATGPRSGFSPLARTRATGGTPK